MSWYSDENLDDSDDNDEDISNKIITEDLFETLEEATEILDKLRTYAYSNGLDMLSSDDSIFGMMELIKMSK